MWLTFDSDLPAEDVAKFLVPLVYGDEHTPESGVPFLGSGGRMWELSRMNDHKLDVQGGGVFNVRDRYNNKERLERYEVALRAWPHARNIRWT